MCLSRSRQKAMRCLWKICWTPDSYHVPVVKNSQLGTVAQVQFFQNSTEIVSHSSLTQIQSRGNFFVVKAVCDFYNDFPFFFCDIIGFRGKRAGILTAQKFRQFCRNGISKDGLPIVDSRKSRDDTLKILF